MLFNSYYLTIRTTRSGSRSRNYYCKAGHKGVKGTVCRGGICKKFGKQNLGFPTDRRPRQSGVTLVTQLTESDKDWLEKSPKIIRELAEIQEQRRKARFLIATWRDIFVENITKIPQTDLIEHRTPIYGGTTPSVAKPVLYTAEEVEWQNKNLPRLIETGTIAQCVSPWSPRTRFSRKENGILRMVHAFRQLNQARSIWEQENQHKSRKNTLRSKSLPSIYNIFIFKTINKLPLWQIFSPSLTNKQDMVTLHNN